MTHSTRRRLLIGVVIAAAVLVGGRAASALYADYTWYAVLGASSLWRERTGDLLLIYGIGSVIAVLVAFLNLSALGRSIGVLTLPRRLANVEFGEAVPRKYIDRFAFFLSIALAAAVTPALPPWTSLALARLGASFRESDPYFQHDLAFYTTWLPLEKAVYSLAMLLSVGVDCRRHPLLTHARLEVGARRTSHERARQAAPERAGGAAAAHNDVELPAGIVRASDSRER